MAAIVYISAEEAEILLPVNEYCLVVDYRGSCSKVISLITDFVIVYPTPLWLSKDNYTACYCPLNHCRWRWIIVDGVGAFGLIVSLDLGSFARST
jgi:hypothetical protein